MSKVQKRRRARAQLIATYLQVNGPRTSSEIKRDTELSYYLTGVALDKLLYDKKALPTKDGRFRFTKRDLGIDPKTGEVKMTTPTPLEDTQNPDWFTNGGLDVLHYLSKRDDHTDLLDMAERIWPYRETVPSNVTDHNRAAWYRAKTMMS